MSQRKKGVMLCSSGLSSFSRQIASFNLVLPFTKSKLHYQSTKTLKGLPSWLLLGDFCTFFFSAFQSSFMVSRVNNSHLHNPARRDYKNVISLVPFIVALLGKHYFR